MMRSHEEILRKFNTPQIGLCSLWYFIDFTFEGGKLVCLLAIRRFQILHIIPCKPHPEFDFDLWGGLWGSHWSRAT